MTHIFASGVISAPAIPFREDSSIDWGTLERYMDAIARGGAKGIAINMAASEGGSLEPEEQREIVRRTKAAVAGACPVISGVIATHTAGAVNTARSIVEAGADGVVVFPPLPTFAGKPLPVSMVVDYHSAIAEAVDRPVIAFQTSNIEYPAGSIAAMTNIPNLVAIKDAAFNIERTADILEEVAHAPRRIGVLTGNDTFIFEALLLGCSGALIGFAGTATAELVRMQGLAERGAATEALAIWRRLGPLARFIWSAPLRDFRARMKYVLLRQGIFPSAMTRAPQPPINAKDKARIDAIFAEHGLDDEAYLPAGGRPAQRRAS